MQLCGSINKPPTKLNATKNKFDTGDLFTNRENHRGETSPGNFKITTPKNSLLLIISGYKYKEFYQTL